MFTIGEVLKALNSFPDKRVYVFYDFCQCVPTHLGSWRGIYAEPTLGWDSIDTITIQELITEIEKYKTEVYMTEL